MEGQIWYTARKPLTQDDSAAWSKYVSWSKLSHCKEIISLDYILCPNTLTVDNSDTEKWDYLLLRNAIESDLYSSLDFVISRLDRGKKATLLAVQMVTKEFVRLEIDDFEFIGYDLVDKDIEISALTNCGGFPDVFENSELNVHGLIGTLDRALSVQSGLVLKYPDERHADCDIWSISVRRIG